MSASSSPTLTTAEACYNSAAYQEAMSHARGASVRDLVIVEGIAPSTPQTSARLLNGLAWLVASSAVAPIVAAAAGGAGRGSRRPGAASSARCSAATSRNTLMLAALVAAGTAAIGTGAAWLVAMYRFPGARAFEVLLVLPLAFPAYVLAYAYTDLLSHPGAVQTTLRAVTGWGPRDYWFPNVRSLPGAAVMLVCVYYPYVYLLARTAFAQQSASAYLAARTLGRGPWGRSSR